jgi:mRNA deadenylase 3'-5' endonuclease subunit Ccr4
MTLEEKQELIKSATSVEELNQRMSEIEEDKEEEVKEEAAEEVKEEPKEEPKVEEIAPEEERKLIRNEDGTYSVVETKLRSTTLMSKGQKAVQQHVGANGGWFEVRTEISEWDLNKKDRIFIKDYNRKNKYE